MLFMKNKVWELTGLKTGLFHITQLIQLYIYHERPNVIVENSFDKQIIALNGSIEPLISGHLISGRLISQYHFYDVIANLDFDYNGDNINWIIPVLDNIRKITYIFYLTKQGKLYLHDHTPVNFLTNIVQMNIDTMYPTFLDCDGNAYCCKDHHNNRIEDIEIISTINNIVQISSDGLISFALKSTGEVYEHRLKQWSLIPELKDIVSISSGVSHSLFLTANGEVYARGCNDRGQLGLDIENYPQTAIIPTRISNLHNIIQISTGYHHSALLTKDGYVYIFGYNILNTNSDDDYHKPILIPGLSDVVQIIAGCHYLMAFTSSNHIITFGHIKKLLV